MQMFMYVVTVPWGLVGRVFANVPGDNKALIIRKRIPQRESFCKISPSTYRENYIKK